MVGGFSTAKGIARHSTENDTGVNEARMEQFVLDLEPEEPEETAR